MSGWIDCTGDIVAGDTVMFTELVWPAWTGGRKKRPLGERTITAEIAADSYGETRGTHTFSLRIVNIEGMADGIKPGDKTRRKARTIYRAEPVRKLWADESERDAAAREKHGRGDAVRAVRAAGGYDRANDL